MNIIKKFLYFWGLAAVLVACSSDKDIPDAIVTENENEVVDILNVTIAGHEYANVPTSYDEDGNFVFHDEVVAEVFDASFPDKTNISVDIKSENSISVYRNLEENLASNNLKLIPESNLEFDEKLNDKIFLTRAALTYTEPAYLVLYDDKEFKDTALGFSLSYSATSFFVARLKDHKFNDKCSSIMVGNNLPYSDKQSITINGSTYPCLYVDAVMLGYENTNYSGRSITCVCHAAEVKRYSSLPGFNDKLSSFMFRFAQRGMYGDSM